MCFCTTSERGQSVQMALNRGYAAYQTNRIKTATPAELTLMLYEGAIKFCNIAKDAVINGEIEKANTYIKKTQDIISEFQITLNHKYPVAEDFDRVYTYLYKLLLEANFKKDADMLEEALEHLRVMRDTWKECMRLTKNGTDTSVGR